MPVRIALILVAPESRLVVARVTSLCTGGIVVSKKIRLTPSCLPFLSLPEDAALDHLTGREQEDEIVSVLLPPQLCLINGLRKDAILLSKHLPHVMWWVHTLLLSMELRTKLAPNTW